MSNSIPPQLILASTSKYRQELLSRLRIPFICIAPQVDETALPDETPLKLAQRLAKAKAHAVAQMAHHNSNSNNIDHINHSSAFIIGSDQVLDLNGEALGKPHTHENAVSMLRRLRGQTMQFHTAIAIVQDGRILAGVDTVRVKIKPLTDAQIETYLRLDTPYDCAGSCKSETIGIALCEQIESHDPTSLIGLPLILTVNLLAQLGYDVLEHAGKSGVLR